MPWWRGVKEVAVMVRDKVKLERYEPMAARVVECDERAIWLEKEVPVMVGEEEGTTLATYSCLPTPINHKT